MSENLIDLTFLNPIFEVLPIGDRAEILGMLESVNNISEGRTGLDKQPIGALKIRKNFTWGHDTRPRIRKIIESFRWKKKRGSLTSMFNNERMNRDSYLERRFTNNVKEVDNKLRTLRWMGAQWLDNDIQKDKVITNAKDKFHKEMSEVCDIYNLNCIEHIMDLPRYTAKDGIIIDSLIPILDSIESVSEQTNDIHFIRFKDEENINIVFDIKGDMEIFHQHNKVPLQSIPHGKIIVILEYDYKSFARKLLNLAHNSNRDHTDMKIFFKSENNNPSLKHPFITVGANINWNIDNGGTKWNWQSGNLAACFGDFNINTYVQRFELIKMMHSLIMWNKIFRIGITNPINHIGYSWHGMVENPTPEIIKANAAFFPHQCSAMIRTRRDTERNSEKEELRTITECHTICSQCEDRCIEAEKKYKTDFMCSLHPHHTERKEIKENNRIQELMENAVKENENQEQQHETEQSIEEVEEEMRRWAVANR